MNFLETIFANLEKTPEKAILSEVHESQLVQTSCQELLTAINRARAVLKEAGLRRGDRCALLAPNSSRWVAADLAVMAEGGIVVPLYARQAPAELVAMMRDCTPKLLVCADEELKQSIVDVWPEAPRMLLYGELFSSGVLKAASGTGTLVQLSSNSAVTIIYTSGTSGDAKGVVLNAGNINFMVQRTTARLEELMTGVAKEGDDRVFHYLPFCFAGSWILLLTCLYRNNSLMMSMDLNKLADELKVAMPHYMLNVPALLDRIRNGAVGQLKKKGGLVLALFENGQAAWLRRRNRGARAWDGLWNFVAASLVFPKIKQQLGPNLRALICGSAPLAEETQLFFQMIAIPVLQVYGLTETTAICTMDDVYHNVPGRVGSAIPGIEMTLGENDEIRVRGPNIFPGYWNRAETTAEVLKDGWFHTGDQGQVDEKGNWKVIGRLKNLIIPSSGLNISPEPIEQMIMSALPETEQVMLVGNGRKFLSLIVTGGVSQERVQAALDAVNRELPHYKQVRRVHLSPEPFSAENGLLTANRKMKRAAIEARYREEIEALYTSEQQV
ncbi:MAG: AMP-binding protein [Acidobacteria bacterium]|nr:AMP-binding protein [Acidobacteriota bacterium]MCI0721924.1 AMP-binding protein [Acidobacteriota bacterium]